MVKEEIENELDAGDESVLLLRGNTGNGEPSVGDSQVAAVAAKNTIRPTSA